MIRHLAICPAFHSLLPALLALLAVNTAAAASYDGQRWFEVELSIFANLYPEYRNAELWTPDRLQLAYPDRIRKFSSLAEFLAVAEFDRGDDLDTGTNPETGPVNIVDALNPAVDLLNITDNGIPLAEVGPLPRKPDSGLRLPDFDRDPFLLLPASLSAFQTTNDRLERSPDHRLLFTGLWRQPVVRSRSATALLVRGGRQVGPHHELEGSITIRFNENEDRVVIDANLWLTEFAAGFGGQAQWQLPLPPTALVDPPRSMRSTDGGITAPETNRRISRIVQMRQSRAMRSDEFHYLDHPALGIVISVKPYELPPPVQTMPMQNPEAGPAAPVSAVDNDAVVPPGTGVEPESAGVPPAAGSSIDGTGPDSTGSGNN